MVERLRHGHESAGGTGFWVLPERAPLSVILVSSALSVPGTSSAEPHQVWEPACMYEAQATGAGVSPALPALRSDSAAEATRRAVSELRRLSGLTWDQLATLFGVSRRSVHFWASGKPLNAENEARLQRVLDVVREADRGDARSTRAALLEATRGRTPFDLLARQRFEDAEALLGPGPGRREVARTPSSPEARAARRPPPPEERIESEQEPVHKKTGHARAARTVRNKRRGRGG